MRIIHITDISDIIDIITIIRIVECFQCRHECAFEGLGSSVSRSRCWEQEKNPSIPESIWRHNKGTIIDTLLPNHDKAEAMTAMKRFRWKWIAVNPLYTVVFGMTKHQTLEQSTMTLAFGRILQFQCPEESSYLKNNTYNKYKPYNTTRVQNFGSIIFVWRLLLLSTGLEQESTDSLEKDLTARPRAQ